MTESISVHNRVDFHLRAAYFPKQLLVIEDDD